MKKAIIINDLSGLGKCSLTAAIPVISAMGVQAIPLPTAVLSNQTDFDSYYCVDLSKHVKAYTEEWKKRFLQPDAIYTGFMMNAEQVETFCRFINDFADDNTLVLTDPVMGDLGDVYDIFSEELLESMRKLVRRAQVITPNLTEALLLLYGKEEMRFRWERGISKEEYTEIGKELLSRFDLRGVVITGIDFRETTEAGELTDYVGTFVCEKSVEGATCHMEACEKIGGSYSGTGDLFASVICGGVLRGMSLQECVRKASGFIAKALRETVKEKTDRNEGICFELFLRELM